MKGVNVSGIVTSHDDDVRLIRGGDIYQAIRDKSPTIAEAPWTSIDTTSVVRNVVVKHGLRWTLTVGPPPLSLPPIGMTGGGSLPPFPYSEKEASDYTLVSMNVGSATILTKSEEYAYQLQGMPSDCYCTGPRQHGYPRLHDPACNFDRYTIDCGP